MNEPQKEDVTMKKVISLLLTAMLLLSMLPATMAEGVEYIPAPYALDAERAGPKAYVEPVFYVNRPSASPMSA